MYLAPRKRSPFAVFASSPPAGVASYRLSVDSDATTGRTRGGLRITRGAVRDDTIGNTIYPGQLTNSTTRTADFPYVDLTRYDSSGAVRDTGWTILEKVPAAATRPWRIYVDKDPAVNRVAFQVYDD